MYLENFIWVVTYTRNGVVTMATTIKVTKAVKFGAIADYFGNMSADVVVDTAYVNDAKIDITAGMLADAMRHELELLTTKKKPSPKQVSEQEVRKNRADMVMEFLRDHKDERFTISELQRKVPGLPAEINTSAVTALFRLPVLIQHSKRTVDKGRPYYQYVE